MEKAEVTSRAAAGSPTKEDYTDAESQVVEYTRAEERRLLRKFDFSILPPLTIMWIYSSCTIINISYENLGISLMHLTRVCVLKIDVALADDLDEGNVGNAKTDGWDKVRVSFLGPCAFS